MRDTLGEAGLIDALPPLQRLALAYAPARSRSALIALFALDARLADIVRHAHEPMLAQLRLAWWREQLSGAGSAPVTGDPLLQLLRDWPGPRSALSGLAEGWEAMTGPPPLAPAMFAALAEARGQAFAALTHSADDAANALRMGQSWALADIAAHLSDPRECEAVLALVRARDWRWQRLPRALRPLAVLHGLAARTNWLDTNWLDTGARPPEISLGPGALLAAVRIGITGR